MSQASKVVGFQRAIKQLCNSPNTWLLLAILFAFQTVPFVWKIIFTPDTNLTRLEQIQISLGLEQSALFSGNIWQLISYTLIHGNWAHLLLNGAAILILGSKLEHIISKRSYWQLCLYSALVGGLAFLLMTPAGHTLVGSSSICFSFLLALTTLSPDSRFLPLFLNGRTLGVFIILANLLLALLNPELPTGPISRFGESLSVRFPDFFKASHACHLGGSITGWIYGRFLLRPRITKKALQRAREKSERRNQA